ncbi:cytochrome oxidase assembly protein ShyY1 [Lipingzhangella halophila]|uniref:SURF1-like protein n=1 Tax=Lipingzhangella halophila TaxID=1783352 RepID=A0A7W7RLP5_9ACTN|nr:SURF1 family protein [Lipingzhangella halophila]MBB4934300.1 cytochrome oxidase assembly protein ShyY1 [Lipingzhangella halophila]
MRSPLLQPRWLGIHVLAVLGAVCCFLLGYWQFERAQEPSRGVITNPVEDPSAATDLHAVLEPGEYMPENQANTAVTATGEYDAGSELLVPARSPDGAEQEGYNVVAPLVTEEGTAVAVHRGWVDGEAADTPDDLAPLPEGEVTVTGWVQPPQKKNDEGAVPMDMPEGQVARLAPSLLMNAWPYQLYEGYILLAGQEPAPEDGDAGGAGAQPQQVPPPDPPEEVEWNWRSLSYAAQWEVFGIAVLVFWIVLMRREREGTRPGNGSGGGTAGPDDGSDGPDGTPDGERENPASERPQPSPTGTSAA